MATPTYRTVFSTLICPSGFWNVRKSLIALYSKTFVRREIAHIHSGISEK